MALISQSQLGYTTKEACWLLSIMVLDVLGCIGNGSDSQILGIIKSESGWMARMRS